MSPSDNPGQEVVKSDAVNPELDKSDISLADVFAIAADNQAMLREILDSIQTIQAQIAAGVEAVPGMLNKLRTLPLVGGAIGAMLDKQE